MIDSTTTEASATASEAGEPKADVTAVDTATTATTSAAAPDTQAKPAEVPESYEFTMPEGIAVDKTAAEEFAAIAKELKLDQAGAQKVADVGAKMAQRQAEAHTALVQSWVEQTKADKEIGGDKLNENLAVARKAIDAFGTPELNDVLNATGFGNHPAVIKAFYKAGMAISGDRFVSGNPKGPETDMAKKMFPSMN